MRTAKVVSISLPPDMQKELFAFSKDERRSISEIIREAFRQYAASRTLTDLRNEAKKMVKKKGLKPSDIDAMISEGRRK